jgi:Flp pilus assembly pilin Flp
MWNDDAGIVALEYLLVATIIGLGLVVGLANVSIALNSELTELGQAILALDQGYFIVAQSSCGGAKSGSSASDSNGTMVYGKEPAPATSNNLQTISVNSCN